MSEVKYLEQIETGRKFIATPELMARADMRPVASLDKPKTVPAFDGDSREDDSETDTDGEDEVITDEQSEEHVEPSADDLESDFPASDESEEGSQALDDLTIAQLIVIAKDYGTDLNKKLGRPAILETVKELVAS